MHVYVILCTDGSSLHSDQERNWFGHVENTKKVMVGSQFSEVWNV